MRRPGAAPPAGPAGGDGGRPDVAQFKLEAGDCVVLISDGITGGEGDQWLRDRLAAFDGSSPKELAQDLLEESEGQGGAADDRTVLVIRIAQR